MTVQQLYVFNGIYFVVLCLVAVLARATPRRVEGALAGGVAAGIVALGIIELGERAGWWHMVVPWKADFLVLLMLNFAVCGFVFLITWRIARRFGGRGLALAAVVAAIIGPPRDYAYMRLFPEWGHYAPGIAPILALSAAYVILGVVGHGVMRLVAGPAGSDRLARRPWE